MILLCFLLQVLLPLVFLHDLLAEAHKYHCVAPVTRGKRRALVLEPCSQTQHNQKREQKMKISELDDDLKLCEDKSALPLSFVIFVLPFFSELRVRALRQVLGRTCSSLPSSVGARRD